MKHSLIAPIVLLFSATSAIAQVTGTYSTYGSGCAGSGTSPGGGVVIPPQYANAWAESNNVFPFGWTNQHYMQAHGSSEVSVAPVSVVGLAFRSRTNSTLTARVIDCKVKVGYTSSPAPALNTTFASNWLGAPQTGFNGNLNVPSAAANTDFTKFDTKVLFTTPFIYIPSRGNLLWEVENRTTSGATNVYDRVGNTSRQIGRMWATGSTTATGTFRAGEGLVVQLMTPGGGRAIVNLSNNGVPTINRSFSVDVSRAAANAPAALWLGASQLNVPIGAVAPGCSLLVSLDAIFGVVATDASGNGSIPIALPNNPSLVGIQFYNQFMVVDAAANTLGLAFSNGGAGKVGG